jgi:hypothetical protein
MKIAFDTVAKPISERIILAACLYYGVDRDWFMQKSEKSIVVLRRGLIYYLLRQNTNFSYKHMADIFGFKSHQPVMRIIKEIEGYQTLYPSLKTDMDCIMSIAEKINPKMIICDVSFVIADQNLMDGIEVSTASERVAKHINKLRNRKPQAEN